jgi:hypothetical protein
MILQSKLAEDREYRIHEVCALLTDALLCIFRRDDKAFRLAITSAFVHALPFTMLRWESLIAAKRRGEGATRGTASSPALNCQGARKLRFYTLFIIKCGWFRIQSGPNPTKTRSYGLDPARIQPKTWF